MRVELSTRWILRNIYFNNLAVAPVKTRWQDDSESIFRFNEILSWILFFKFKRFLTKFMFLKPHFSLLLFATFLFINTLRVASESVIWKIYLPKLSLFLCRFISQPLLGLLSAMHFKVVDLNSTKFVCVNFNMWIESGLIWESLHAGRECKFIEIYANLIILVVRVKKGSSNSLIALWANGSFIINDSGRQTTLEIRKSHYKLMNLINNLLSLTFHFR